MRLQKALCSICLVMAAWSAAKADTMSLGIISYDSIIAGVSDQFTISNLTGTSDLPPDFPIITNVTFLSAELQLFGPSATAPPIGLGVINPGFAAAATGLFADSSQFTSAVFTATLSVTGLSIDGGGSETVDSSISAVLMPSSGPYLQAGIDTAVIEAAPMAAVPDPSSVVLFMTAIVFSALFYSGARRRVCPK